MKNIFLGLFAVAALFLAASLWQQTQRVKQLEFEAIASANTARAAQKQVQETERRLAETEKARADLEAEAKNLRGRPAAAPRPAAARATDPMAAAGAMLDNPNFQRVMATSMKGGLDQRYAALFRQLKLSPADLDKFKDLLVEKQMSGLDVVRLAQTRGAISNPADIAGAMNKVLTANLSLPRRYGTPVQQRDFAARWLAALQASPGVKLSALTDIPPLSNSAQVVFSSGGPARENASASSTPATMSVASITPDFFRATGITLRQGRFFTDSDGADAPAVAIVNESFIKQNYPKGFTLGATVNVPSTGPGGHGPPPTAAIVGVVADIRPRGFESTAQPLAYFPLAQQPRARVSAVLQFEGDSATLSRAVTTATHKLDADLALDNPQTLEQQLARQTAPRRATLMLTGAFAATAVLLAALGIFGVMSFTVTQRTQEIGVRMALGADAANILRWMLRYGIIAVGAGLVIGLALTVATTRLLTTLLAGVTALDPRVVAAGVAVLAFIGLAACLWPAFRATRVNPVVALRSE